MSDITTQQVAHLASLSRIHLSQNEIEHLAGELNQIVDAVATVSQVASDDVPATSHPIALTNVFRDDEIRSSFSSDQALAAAPAREGNYFRVPAVLEGEQEDAS